MVLCLLLSVLTGCHAESAPATESTTSQPDTSEAAEVPVDSTPAESESEAPAVEDTEVTVSSYLPEDYPRLANNDVTISAWFSWPPPMDASNYAGPEEFPIWKKISEITGINFEFTVVGMASASEQFSLLVAAESLPDLLTEPSLYSNGQISALDEEVFYDITGLIEDYAPDYYKLVSQEDNYRNAYTDDKRIGVFWQIAEEEFKPNSGLVVRKDILDDLGLSVPETYDELHDVLATVKAETGMECPFFIEGVFYTPISGGYDVAASYACINEKAVYNVLAEDFPEYIEMLASWYSEGLIYQEFYQFISNTTTISKEKKALVDTDNCFLWNDWCEDVSNYEPSSPDYSLIAITDPVRNSGENNHLCAGIDAKMDGSSGWAISGSVDKETAILLCELCNYFYTDEGSILANWGTEGESFEYDENGNPVFTDLVMNNPALMSNMCISVQTIFHGAYKADMRKFNQKAMTVYAEYCDVWAAQDNNYRMPNISLTAEEQERYTALSSDVETAIDENIVRFVMGDRPLDELDAFIQQLNAIGLEEMVNIKQTALDRYYSK